MNPEVGNLMNNYNRNVQLYEYTKKDDTSNFDEIRQMIFKDLGLVKQIKPAIEVTSANHVETDHSFNIFKFLFLTLYEWSWYASDFLYWLIYFSAFITAQQSQLINDKSNIIILNNSNRKHRSNFIEIVKEPIISFMKIFDELGIYFVANLKRTPIWFVLEELDSKLNAIRLYSLFKLVINFTSIFRILGFVCIFGGISKFYINFSWLLHCISEIVKIEDEFRAKNSQLV